MEQDIEISFGATESLNDSRTLSADNIALGGIAPETGKVVLDYDHVNDLCDQRKLGICTMCAVRMAAEAHFKDGVRLDEYWGYLIGKTFYDDPVFGHFEGSSALTMLKTANNWGIPEKEFCKSYKLKTDGTYAQFIQSFLTEYNGEIPERILENASKHKIPGYYRIFGDALSGSSPSASGIAKEVNKGRVIIARFSLGNNLHTDINGKYTRSAKDILPVRRPEKITSGHLMNINEFWDFGQELGGPNSWSRTWCFDNEKQEPGYYWFDYETQKGFFTEAWAIMQKGDAYVFNNNLTLGSTGPDVVALQKILVFKKLLVMPKGVSYGFFGRLTQRAVADYQVMNDIKPALGFFGPLTRAHINENQWHEGV